LVTTPLLYVIYFSNFFSQLFSRLQIHNLITHNQKLTNGETPITRDLTTCLFVHVSGRSLLVATTTHLEHLLSHEMKMAVALPLRFGRDAAAVKGTCTWKCKQTLSE